MTIRIVMLAAAPLLLWGCASRNHLTPTHGRAFSQTLARQAANPQAGTQPVPAKGLDSQEAAIIAQSYRAQMIPEGSSAPQEQLLLVAPGAKPGGGRLGDYMPPASVPTER